MSASHMARFPYHPILFKYTAADEMNSCLSGCLLWVTLYRDTHQIRQQGTESGQGEPSTQTLTRPQKLCLEGLMSDASRAQRNQPFDAITLDVLSRRTISAVDEAAKALRRTSFSTLVNESNAVQRIASMPLRLMTWSSASAGPEGRFAPRSSCDR
jgi:hypothetical protein